LRPLRTVLLAALVVVTALLLGAARASADPAPGLPMPVTTVPTAPNGDPLLPFTSESGLIALSVDAAGTNDPAGTTITVQKHAGATVRKAYLFAASTGFSGYTPANGDITLNGTAVTWNPANTISNAIGSVNAESDVTSIVKPIVDPAPAGNVDMTIAEGAKTGSYDGEILAVILDDPTVTTSGSVTLMYGAQQTTGDTFNVALADPVNLGDPNFGMNLSLGISYGFQPAGQFSTVDVNGTRMTTSAGGQDDGQPANGALITAGGVGDLNDNPPDPNANDTTCMGAKGPAPLCDDELYNLVPFLHNGDTSLTFHTQNPSNDDNMFFAALDTRGAAALVGAGVLLSPSSATNPINTSHTLTATVQDQAGHPVSGVTVTFTVTSGPNAGVTGTGVTGADGKATFSYSSSVAGTDHIVASFHDATGALHTSNEVTKTWEGQGDTTPPVCTGYYSGKDHSGHGTFTFVMQDTGSGIKSVEVVKIINATFALPPFTVGTTDVLTGVQTYINNRKPTNVDLRVTDVAGNVTDCDPWVATMRVSKKLKTGVHTSVQVYTAIPEAESQLAIVNGKPGLRRVRVTVNGRVLWLNRIGPHQRVLMDLSRWMKPGSGNTIRIRGYGRRGSSARIELSNLKS
jgi:hypothetical protein